MAEFEVMAKDYIKLNFLKEVVTAGGVSFKVFLESDGIEKDFREIRSDKNVYRFNNFNVSEDMTQNMITFRPIVVGCYLYFKVITSVPLKLAIIKNGTTSVAKEFVLVSGENRIVFEPEGTKKYVMKLKHRNLENSNRAFVSAQSFGGDETVFSSGNEGQGEQFSSQRVEEDIIRLEGEIEGLEGKRAQLAEKKTRLIAHLDKLQQEYKKDYAAYVADAEEIKGKYKIDEAVLRMYLVKEVTPIEELLARAEQDIKEMEDQMRIFIKAQQRKTDEIEQELKIGKKE